MGGGAAFNTPGAAGFQRPLVVVMHRGMDLVSALRHNRYTHSMYYVLEENSNCLDSNTTAPPAGRLLLSATSSSKSRVLRGGIVQRESW